MTAITTDPAARQVFISGFRALAEFLEGHPDLPVPSFSVFDGLTLYPQGSDPDRQAEVDRVARVLQVAPGSYAHYQACRRFGEGVSYRIIAVPADDLADDDAGEA